MYFEQFETEITKHLITIRETQPSFPPCKAPCPVDPPGFSAERKPVGREREKNPTWETTKNQNTTQSLQPLWSRLCSTVKAAVGSKEV